MKYRIVEHYKTDRYGVEGYETEMPNFEAKIAIDLMVRWGEVAAVEDGEDTAGRQKLRLLSPEEVAVRACKTAACAVAEFRARGWMVEVPDLAELNPQEDKS